MTDYLIHYGVKGMKWGVRKQQKYLKKSEDLKRKAERLRKSKIGDYDDEEYYSMQDSSEKAEAKKRAKKLADSYEKQAQEYANKAKSINRANNSGNRSRRQKAIDRINSEGASKYGIEYTRFGNTRIIDQSSGNKMKYGTSRAIEKAIKSEDVQKYREYKRYKKAANSGMTYIGNDTNTAVMVSAINASTKGSRNDAKVKAQQILIDYGNSLIYK